MAQEAGPKGRAEQSRAEHGPRGRAQGPTITKLMVEVVVFFLLLGFFFFPRIRPLNIPSLSNSLENHQNEGPREGKKKNLEVFLFFLVFGSPDLVWGSPDTLKRC
jgi:hypothetical protein